MRLTLSMLFALACNGDAQDDLAAAPPTETAPESTGRRFLMNGHYTVGQLVAFTDENVGVTYRLQDADCAGRVTTARQREHHSEEETRRYIAGLFHAVGLRSEPQDDGTVLLVSETPCITRPHGTLGSPPPSDQANEVDAPSFTAEQIQEVGPSEREVDRSLLHAFLADTDSLSALGRAIPHRGSDGNVDGYRVSGIRRRSLGDALGLANGDVVHAINGSPLTSASEVFAVLESIQNDESVAVEVTRRGEPMVLQYRIQP